MLEGVRYTGSWLEYVWDIVYEFGVVWSYSLVILSPAKATEYEVCTVFFLVWLNIVG